MTPFKVAALGSGRSGIASTPEASVLPTSICSTVGGSEKRISKYVSHSTSGCIINQVLKVRSFSVCCKDNLDEARAR